MPRCWYVLSLATASLLLGSAAVAQRPAYSPRPTFSPYLNLARSGSPALNYYGLVRPHQQLRSLETQYQTDSRQVRSQFQNIESRQALDAQSIRRLQESAFDRSADKQLEVPAAPSPERMSRPTSSYFFNTSRYFPRGR